ncbi:MAG: type IX secretion system sortase PorU [Sphingobacteriales bacterium]|nr:MAG: type IX secretion system sortase PorU [Sphingobacteriales bacterium]
MDCSFKKLLPALVLGCASGVQAQESATYTLPQQVSAAEQEQAFIVRQIPLNHAVLPIVTVTDARYTTTQPRPEDTASLALKVVLGTDRKKPFALVAVPVRTAQGRQALNAFTLVVKEQPSNLPEQSLLNQAKTAATTSPLATGNWYKLSVNAPGFYKVDYAFLTANLNVSGPVPSASIRLLGNGGAMLDETNPAILKTAIPENNLWIQDGGDGTLDAGDYVVFWSPGPQSWTADATQKRYSHRKNLYEDKSYYFLSAEGGSGKTVSTIANAPATAQTDVTAYDCLNVIDDDLVNLGNMGKRWVGDEFTGGSKTYSFDFSNAVSPLRIRTNVAARNNGGAEQFQISLNGVSLGRRVLSFRSGVSDVPCTDAQLDAEVPFAAGQASVTIGFSPAGAGSRGYLDYLEVIGRRSLVFNGGFLTFRDMESVDSGTAARFTIQNASGTLQVWDVTEPWNAVRMAGTLQNGSYVFINKTDQLREYAAFDGSAYSTPVGVGKVDNQNLMGAADADYLIVTHKNFLTDANRLADWHRTTNGYRVQVVTTEQVYNEFSSGGQDIGGIRDYTRFFYDRAGTDSTRMPRFLLLFGDASFDYKDRVPSNTNYVPVYESSESNVVLDAYTTDDYFGFLDAGESAEGSNVYNVLDIGVGRLPVKTPAEAKVVVDKILHYKSPASLGPWRVTGTLVADQEDGAGAHLANAEEVGDIVRNVSPVFNEGKIYMDNYPVVSTPAGPRAPEVNAQISNQIYKGTQYINYAGHGGIRELAQERVLTVDDINRWKNLDKLPFMVTATCDFAQYDRPDFMSAGEQLMLKADGGMIAMLTTTQAVYEFGSRVLNNDYILAQFRKQQDGRWATFGDALRNGKNATYKRLLQYFPAGTWGTLLNFRKFALLGDPALTPNLPAKLNAVQTNAVVEVATGLKTDSLAALGRYVLDGSVTDGSGNPNAAFSGRVYVTIFDKARSTSVRTVYDLRTFETRNNIVFKGRANVVNGQFSIPFVAPKDLNYEMGIGQIQYYAEDGSTDVAGVDTTIRIGGSSRFPVTDDQPPVVRPFIGDSLFRNGGLTGANTAIYGILEDETGINVSGNAIGHDLVAVIDGKESEPYVLNDYYENAPNTYKKGFVRFPVTGLSNGLHTLRIKAWDMANNSGEGTIQFRVGDGKVVEVQELLNYPNPFKDQTRFRFEHNHPDENMTAEVQIFSSAGSLVRTIRQAFTPTGSHSSEIVWDGAGDTGMLLPSGIYIYRMVITTAQKSEGLGYQKLVIAR